MITVAVVGTGPKDFSNEWASRAYYHGDAVRRIDGCELVACADLVEENARRFAAEFDLPDGRVFTDYGAMLADVSPDLVSVCTPPTGRTGILLDCLRSEGVAAVHSEKPMASTYGDARLLYETAERRDVQLTFHHQRRLWPPMREARRLVEEGVVGELRRVEIGWGDFFDQGTHAVDLAGLFAGDRPAEWVLGQLDDREEREEFGVPTETQMLAQWRYGNGVHGLAATGPGSDLVDADWRLVGTEGAVEVHLRGGFRADRTVEVVSPGGSGGRRTNSDEWNQAWNDETLRSVVRGVRDGTEPELRARNALNATEIIFAGYESARRRGRVDLPLDVDDHPLTAMVERGDLRPESAD